MSWRRVTGTLPRTSLGASGKVASGLGLEGATLPQKVMWCIHSWGWQTPS